MSLLMVKTMSLPGLLHIRYEPAEGGAEESRVWGAQLNTSSYKCVVSDLQLQMGSQKHLWQNSDDLASTARLSGFEPQLTYLPAV